MSQSHDLDDRSTFINRRGREFKSECPLCSPDSKTARRPTRAKRSRLTSRANPRTLKVRQPIAAIPEALDDDSHREPAAKAYAKEHAEPACWGLANLRVHDLKHTMGRRLRAAGVPLETRKVLLGHRNGDITSHYICARDRRSTGGCESRLPQRLRRRCRRRYRYLVHTLTQTLTKRWYRHLYRHIYRHYTGLSFIQMAITTCLLSIVIRD